MDFSEKWDLLDSNPEAVFKLSPTAIMTPKKKYVISIFVFMFVMTTVFLLQNGYNINNHEYFCDCQPNSDGGKNENDVASVYAFATAVVYQRIIWESQRKISKNAEEVPKTAR